MNVAIDLTNGVHVEWEDVVITFDTKMLQVVLAGVTYTYPMYSVVSFTTSESVPS